MSKKLTFLILLSVFTAVALDLACAQSETETDSGDKPSIVIVSRNPFTPQLPPVIEEEEPESETIITYTEDGEIIETEVVEEEVEPPIIGSPRLVVTGLIWNSDRPQAIVNGNVIEVGDRLFGVPTDNSETIPEITFVNITKEGLHISYLDKEVILQPKSPTKE